MAINKITAPLETSPSVFASPVINQLAALLDCYNKGAVIQSGKILKGSLFCIGGSMYLADSDTAISGTASNYVAITASGDTATVAYVSSLSSVTWNGIYHGYFDTAGVLYLFDESDAINDGYITTRYYIPTPTGEPNKFTAGDYLEEQFRAVFANPGQTTTYTSAGSVIAKRAGKIRVKSYLATSAPSTVVFTAYSKIYVDGVAVGSEHSVSRESSSVFSDDVTVSEGSIISIYVKGSTTDYYAIGYIKGLYCGFRT
jgi:hypothetical protein